MHSLNEALFPGVQSSFVPSYSGISGSFSERGSGFLARSSFIRAAICGSKDGARAGLRVETGGSEADGDGVLAAARS